ncbi:MAG: hypothetical protein IJT48_08925 [Bacteroidaceae bacterium]|nr:hypothetical protein [Bacteroidaceae bacterium]
MGGGNNAISFDGNTITVNTGVDATYPVRLTVTFTDSQGVGAPFYGSTNIHVTIAAVPVTGITCTFTDAVVFKAFDDFATYFNENIAPQVKVSPDDASIQTFHLECDALSDGVFIRGGKFTVNIVPDDQSYQGDPATVDVTVYVYPTNIAATEATIQVNYGDDVYAAIKANQTLTWPTDADPGEWGKSEVEYTFNPKGYIDAAGMATKTGSVNVTVTLKEGIFTPAGSPAQGTDTYNVTVNIVSQLVVRAVNSNTTIFKKNGSVSTETPAYVYVTNPANEPFTADDLSITFYDRFDGFSYAEQSSVVKTNTDEQGVTTYEFRIKPLFIGTASFDVVYDGDNLTSGRITINKEEDLSEGWTWMALAATGGTVADLLTQADIVEVRSQSQLLWNDPQYGYVGPLTTLDADNAMYKVKTNKATTVNWGHYALMQDMSRAYNKTISPGYNWVNYPYEFDLTAARIPEFLGADFLPANDDRIITQSGFATYNGQTQTWNAAETFALKEGKGLMYYSKGEGKKVINFTDALTPTQAGGGNARVGSLSTTSSVAEEMLQYNVHAFADNMSMIAAIGNLENPEDYTLGVFVGDECRGRGRVAVDGKMFVSAVGTGGEKMTFKLVNNLTGEVLPIEGAVSFSQIQGSLQAPVMLNVTDVTAIGKVGATQHSTEVYDLSGRRISGSQRGVSIERTANGTIRKVVKN